MKKQSCIFAIAIGLFSSSTLACDSSVDAYSIMMVDKEQDSICASILHSFESFNLSLISVKDNLITPVISDNYWENWLLKSGSTPLFHSSHKSNYFGIGVWVPETYDDQYEQMTYSEKLQATGLKFSLGLGERKSSQARIRIDYRWHNLQPSDVVFQVEVPF